MLMANWKAATLASCTIELLAAKQSPPEPSGSHECADDCPVSGAQQFSSDIRFADARRRHAVNLGVSRARLDQPRIRHVLLTVDHARGKPVLRFGCRDPVHSVVDVAVVGRHRSEADGNEHLVEHEDPFPDTIHIAGAILAPGTTGTTPARTSWACPQGAHHPNLRRSTCPNLMPLSPERVSSGCPA